MWVKLPRIKNTVAILENAIKKYKVLYVPGAPFFVNPDDGLDCLRLNFSYCDPREKIFNRQISLQIADKPRIKKFFDAGFSNGEKL